MPAKQRTISLPTSPGIQTSPSNAQDGSADETYKEEESMSSQHLPDGSRTDDDAQAKPEQPHVSLPASNQIPSQPRRNIPYVNPLFPRAPAVRVNYDFCLFIANLPTYAEDQALRVAIHAHFGRFGRVAMLKIKRDVPATVGGGSSTTGSPVRARVGGAGSCLAWVCFDNEQSASTALVESIKMPLLGRWIRVERAEAHRTLLLRPIEPWTLVHQSSEEGKRWVAIDEKGERNYDVYTWMKQYGELESITERTIEGIGEDGEKTSGVDIKFRHRDDSIFALNSFRKIFDGVTLSWSHDTKATPSAHPKLPSSLLDSDSAAHSRTPSSSISSNPSVPPPNQSFATSPGNNRPIYPFAPRGGAGPFFGRGGSWAARGQGGRGGPSWAFAGRGAYRGGAAGTAHRAERVEEVKDKAQENFEKGKKEIDGGIRALRDELERMKVSEKERERISEDDFPPLPGSKVPIKTQTALSSSIVMSETSPTTESVRMTSSSPSAAAPIGLRPSPSTLRASLPSTVTLPPISATISAPEVFSSNLSRSPERPSTRSTPGSLQQPKLLADQSTPPASLTPAPDAARQPTPNPFLAPARPTQPLPSTGFESTPALSVGYGSPVSPRDPQTPASVGLGLRGGWYGAAGAKAYDGFGGRSERFEYSDQDVLCDPNAIFVGGLQKESVNEDNLKQRFEQYGFITDLHYVPNAPKTMTGFAFISFSDKHAASAAVENENGSIFFMNKIRVQLREIKPAHLQHFRRSTRETRETLAQTGLPPIEPRSVPLRRPSELPSDTTTASASTMGRPAVLVPAPKDVPPHVALHQQAQMIQYAAATPYFHVDANSPGGGYMVWPQPIYAMPAFFSPAISTVPTLIDPVTHQPAILPNRTPPSASVTTAHYAHSAAPVSYLPPPPHLSPYYPAFPYADQQQQQQAGGGKSTGAAKGTMIGLGLTEPGREAMDMQRRKSEGGREQEQIGQQGGGVEAASASSTGEEAGAGEGGEENSIYASDYQQQHQQPYVSYSQYVQPPHYSNNNPSPSQQQQRFPFQHLQSFYPPLHLYQYPDPSSLPPSPLPWTPTPQHVHLLQIDPHRQQARIPNASPYAAHAGYYLGSWASEARWEGYQQQGVGGEGGVEYGRGG